MARDGEGPQAEKPPVEPTRATAFEKVTAAEMEAFGIRGATEVDIRLVNYDYKVTDITPMAAEVAILQTRARLEIAQADRDARIAEAGAVTAQAQINAGAVVATGKAERDKVIFSTIVVATGIVLVLTLMLASTIVCGVLSHWNPTIVASLAVATIVVLLGGGPTLIKWASARLSA